MVFEPNQLRVLIAEDDSASALSMQRLFERSGFGTLIANDGLETIKLLETNTPDLILLDIQMPGMNGFEVLKQLRTNPSTASIPVVVVTARAKLSEDIEYGFHLGADDYITKPYDPRELVIRCQSKIRFRQLEDALKARTTELESLVKALQRRTAELETLQATIEEQKLLIEQKSVFISYRREKSMHLATVVFKDLLQHGYDAFLDVSAINSGNIDRIVINQIAARAHFILIISQGSLVRCNDETDWLRFELQEAIRLERNIIPVLDDGLHLEEELANLPTELHIALSRRNAIPYNHFYSDAALSILRDRFLKQPTSIVIHSTPNDDLAEVQSRIDKVSNYLNL